jgi:hypothetical protein
LGGNLNVKINPERDNMAFKPIIRISGYHALASDPQIARQSEIPANNLRIGGPEKAKSRCFTHPKTVFKTVGFKR